MIDRAINSILNPPGGSDRPDAADALAIEAILSTTPAERPIGVKGQRFARTAAKRAYQNLLKVENAAAALERLPEAGETIHLIVAGDYRTFDLIGATLRLAAPEIIEELWLATLSYSRDNAVELLALLDAGQVKAATLITSVFDKANDPGRFDFTRDELSKRGQRILAMRNHAKLILLRLSAGRRITVESSANLRSCSTTEQAAITNDKALYNFHRNWMQEVLNNPPEEQT